MGVLGTYCFDGLNFSQASSLYTDSTLSVLAADGFYSQGGVVRQQSNGVLLVAQACGNCSVPCGNGISVSLSQNGFFDINFDVGNTLGAVVAYFYMGSSIADGVIANFNSVNYNRLTAQGNDGTTLVDGSGTAVDYSGIGNQGTGDPTYVGSDTANIIRAYTNTSVTPGVCNTGDAPENYSYAGSSYVAQGTLNPLTVTNAMCGRALSGSPVFTMVIPKASASPTSLNLKISAPACGTFFAYELDCPAGLSSFGSSVAQSTTVCAVNTQTYYFARNATGTNVPFTVDTNTIPNVGNFVFTDANGATYLNDTATIQYYITGNTTAIGVRNGVVVSSGQCTGTPTYSYYIAKGCPGGTYAGFDRKVKSTASLNYNGTPTGGDSFSEFGSCWYIDGASTETAYNANLNCGCGTGNTCTSADCSSLDVSNLSITSGCAACTSGSSQLRISDCQTGNTWTMTNTYGHVLTDVLQYQQGTPGQGAVYCGTVTQVNVSGTNDATVNGSQSYSCSDATHCLQ